MGVVLSNPTLELNTIVDIALRSGTIYYSKTPVFVDNNQQYLGRVLSVIPLRQGFGSANEPVALFSETAIVLNNTDGHFNSRISAEIWAGAEVRVWTIEGNTVANRMLQFIGIIAISGGVAFDIDTLTITIADPTATLSTVTPYGVFDPADTGRFPELGAAFAGVRRQIVYGQYDATNYIPAVPIDVTNRLFKFSAMPNTNLASVVKRTSGGAWGAGTFTNQSAANKRDGTFTLTSNYDQDTDEIAVACDGKGIELASGNVGGVKKKFRPTDISGVQLWLDANQLSGVADGGTVASWADKSGQGNNATQSTEAHKPTFQVNIVNNLPVVRFNDVTDFLTVANPSVFDEASGTIFIVMATDDATAEQEMFSSSDDGGLDTKYMGFGINTNGTFRTKQRDADTEDHVSSISTVSNSTFALLTFNSSGTAYTVHKDGGAAEAVGSNNGDWFGDTSARDNVIVGARKTHSGNSLPFDGDIAEIIVYNSPLTSLDRQKVESYLRYKYSLDVASKLVDPDGDFVNDGIVADDPVWNADQQTLTLVSSVTSASEIVVDDDNFNNFGEVYQVMDQDTVVEKDSDVIKDLLRCFGKVTDDEMDLDAFTQLNTDSGSALRRHIIDPETVLELMEEIGFEVGIDIRKIPAPFEPNDISGLDLWLKADAITGLSDGDSVATWSDSSLEGNDFAQGTASKKPTYKTSIVNQKAVVRFDGGDLLTASNFASETAGTIFVVFQSTDVSADQVLFGTSDEALTTKRFDFGIRGASANLRVRQESADTADDLHGGTIINDTWYVAMLSSSGTAYIIQRSGIAPSLTAVTGSNTGDWFGDTANRDNFSIGAIKTSAEGTFFGGDIAEIIVYTRDLSSDEKRNVAQYLSNKYDIFLAFEKVSASGSKMLWSPSFFLPSTVGAEPTITTQDLAPGATLLTIDDPEQITANDITIQYDESPANNRFDAVVNVSDSDSKGTIGVKKSGPESPYSFKWLYGPSDVTTRAQRLLLLRKNVPKETVVDVGAALLDKSPGDKFRVNSGRFDNTVMRVKLIVKSILDFPSGTVQAICQDFTGLSGFGVWTDDDAPAWASAADVQKSEHGRWLDPNGRADSGDPESVGFSSWF